MTSRTKLKDRALPSYTGGEEIFNMVTHIIGGAVGVATLVLCVIISALKGSVSGVICSAIFGASMVTLYTMSSIYHGLRTDTSKKVFQVIDHCTIYFLIAGTYTPMLVCGLRRTAPVAAWIILRPPLCGSGQPCCILSCKQGSRSTGKRGNALDRCSAYGGGSYP